MNSFISQSSLWQMLMSFKNEGKTDWDAHLRTDTNQCNNEHPPLNFTNTVNPIKHLHDSMGNRTPAQAGGVAGLHRGSDYCQPEQVLVSIKEVKHSCISHKMLLCSSTGDARLTCPTTQHWHSHDARCPLNHRHANQSFEELHHNRQHFQITTVYICTVKYWLNIVKRAMNSLKHTKTPTVYNADNAINCLVLFSLIRK